MDQDLNRLENTQQLLDYFASGETPERERGVGTEHEKFVFHTADASMLSFEQEGGYADLFSSLAQAGWAASYDEGNIVALERDGAALTLEPGGQFELSGGIKRTVFETAAELDAHFDDLRGLFGDRLATAAWGLNPFRGIDEIPWMPKSRYKIMRAYLAQKGDLSHWMMKMTCTVQANFDYRSEQDAARIIRTALRVSPIVSALFASSPITQGKPNGFDSFRCHVWTRMDDDRTGFPDFMYADDWGYQEYLDYVLDVPMFFIRRDKYIPMNGLSFRTFMRQGHDGHHALMGDFELHLSTIFPEVRMKRYIEVRGADAGRREFILALPALWKGLLYDDTALDLASKLLVSSSPAQHRECFARVQREGLRARTECGDFMELARELIAISRDGLDRQAAKNAHPSEATFLAPLERVLETGRTQSDDLMQDFAPFTDSDMTPEDELRIIQKWSLLRQ